MKIILRAGGAMKSGPERELTNDYMDRAGHLARGLGFLSVEEQAVDLSRCKDRAAETRKMMDGMPDGAALFALDERGKSLTSRQFSSTLAKLRDDGTNSAIFMIGGADGFEPGELPSGTRKLSFGQQTWPHKLVRVMATEQIYRALSILAGTPYHRD